MILCLPNRFCVQVEKASGRIQLPHEILVDLLKVDCTVSCYVIATKGY